MLFRNFDAFNGFSKDAWALNGQIVVLLHAVQVHVEEEFGIRLELFDLLANEHPIRAEDDMASARKDVGNQAPDFGIEHRLAPADGYCRRAAFIHGAKALLHGEALRNGALVFADPAATGTGEIAGVQRLQHQHERESLVDHRVLEMRRIAGMRVHDDLEWIGRIVGGGGLLPLRPRIELVFGNIGAHANGHGQRKSHRDSLIIETRSPFGRLRAAAQ